MITTYEKPYSAYRALQTSGARVIEFYRIKNYPMRKTSAITPASRARIARNMDRMNHYASDCGPTWFKTIYWSA